MSRRHAHAKINLAFVVGLVGADGKHEVTTVLQRIALADRKRLSLDVERPDLALVDVSGVRRTVNVALLDDEVLVPGDWILIHVGFALSRIDELPPAGEVIGGERG